MDPLLKSTIKFSFMTFLLGFTGLVYCQNIDKIMNRIGYVPKSNNTIEELVITENNPSEKNNRGIEKIVFPAKTPAPKINSPPFEKKLSPGVKQDILKKKPGPGYNPAKTSPNESYRDYLKCYIDYLLDKNSKGEINSALAFTNLPIIKTRDTDGIKRETFFCPDKILKTDEVQGKLRGIYLEIKSEGFTDLTRRWNQDVSEEITSITRNYSEVNAKKIELAKEREICIKEGRENCGIESYRKIIHKKFDSFKIINLISASMNFCNTEINEINAVEISNQLASLGGISPDKINLIFSKNPDQECAYIRLIVNTKNGQKIMPIPSNEFSRMIDMGKILSTKAEPEKRKENLPHKTYMRETPEQILEGYIKFLTLKTYGLETGNSRYVIEGDEYNRLKEKLNIVYDGKLDDWAGNMRGCGMTPQLHQSIEDIRNDCINRGRDILQPCMMQSVPGRINYEWNNGIYVSDRKLVPAAIKKIADAIGYEPSNVKVIQIKSCNALLLEKEGIWKILPGLPEELMIGDKFHNWLNR